MHFVYFALFEKWCVAGQVRGRLAIFILVDGDKVSVLRCRDALETSFAKALTAFMNIFCRLWADV